MADLRQFQLPDGSYLNQTANDTEWQIPGGPYLNEEATAAVGFVPYPNPRYVMTGGMQPMSGGV